MRSNVWSYVLIILLILMIFGVVSLGDVLGFVFYVILGIAILGAALVLVLRSKVNRARRRVYEQMQNGGQQAGGNDARRGTRERKPEGEVTVKRTTSSAKVVNNDVGSYVEYEEIDEEVSASE